MKNIALIALAAAGFASSAPAAVELNAIHDSSTTTVVYGDLNLETPQGAAQLEKRIASAARRVCPVSGPSRADELRNRSRCVAAATAAARARLRTALADGERRLALAASRN